MLPEITTFATPLALLAASVALALLASTLTGRLPVPAPAIFLVGAAVIAEAWPSLYGDVPILTVERLAVVALVVILLNGGIDIGVARLRGSLTDVTALGIAGTFMTAAAVAATAHLLLGLDWKVAGVIGAALAPTDPAVMFSVLGGREIGGRSGTVLEGEAGVNDPAGIALLLGMVEIATHADSSVWVVLREFVLEMGLGGAAGLAGGWLLVRALQRTPLAGSGQYSVLVLAGAGVLYALASLAGGSGFLAVFVAGLLLGDATVPFRADVERFTAGLADLAEVAVFLALGLTVEIGSISTEDWLGGVALSGVLILAIRPLVVLVTLARSRLAKREKAFVAFAGLKGAVPILLAAFATLGAVPDAPRIYDLVFVSVLLSVGLHGSLVPSIARRLRIPMTAHAPLPWELSVQLAERPDDHLELTVEPGSRADGTEVRELPLGEDAWVTVIVRDHVALAARPESTMRRGDLVMVLGATSGGELERAFASPAAR